MAWTTPRTWTDGELVTKAIMDTHVRDNLNFLLKNAFFQMPGQGAGAGVTFPDTTGGNRPSVGLADAQTNAARISFAVPSFFVSLTKAVVIVVAEGSGNCRRSVNARYGASGQAESTHTGNIAAAEIALTSGQIFEDDISSTLASLAAGDYAGIYWEREGAHANDTVGAKVHVVGILLEWS